MHSILFLGLIFDIHACCIKKKPIQKRVENPVHIEPQRDLKRSPDYGPEDFKKIREEIKKEK